jgi:hypothetical protein
MAVSLPDAGTGWAAIMAQHRCNQGGARFHHGECVAGAPRDYYFAFRQTGLHYSQSDRTRDRISGEGRAGEGVDENCVQSKNFPRERRAGPGLHHQMAGKPEQNCVLKDYFRGQ